MIGTRPFLNVSADVSKAPQVAKSTRRVNYESHNMKLEMIQTAQQASEIRYQRPNERWSPFRQMVAPRKTDGQEDRKATLIRESGSRSRSPEQRRSAPPNPRPYEIVLKFIDRLNARDVAGILRLLEDDIVHHDLAHEQPTTSKLEVARFYQELLSSMSDNMVFVVDDITDGESLSVGLTWHIAVEGIELPLGKGIGFYKVNKDRKITYVRQSPEHFVKVANLALSATGMASPLVNVLGPAANPMFWSNMMDAASSVMGSSQPAEGLQQLLGATGLDTSALFSFFGESKEYQPSHSDNRSVINQAPSLDRSGHVPSRSSSVSAAASAGDARLLPSSVERLSEDGTRSLHIPSPAKSPFEDRGAPVTAAQLASALVEAADAAKVRSPAAAASPCPDPSPDAGAMMADPPLAQGFHNNIVPAPHIPSVHEASGALSSASGDEEPPLIPLPQIFTGPVNLSGIWIKVPELSQLAEYEKVLDLWQISGMQKATAKLIEGLEIQHEGNKFHVHFMTIIPYFKVTEKYDLATPCKVMRRDLRSGQASATAKMLENKQGVALDVHFGQPFPGRLEEVYSSPEPGVMHVTSTIFLGKESLGTTQVYHLQAPGMTKQEFLKQSEKKHGDPSAILRSFGAPL